MPKTFLKEITGSPSFQLHMADLKSLAWRAIEFGGATAVVYALESMKVLQFGQFQPVADLLLGMTISAFRKWLTDNTR